MGTKNIHLPFDSLFEKGLSLKRRVVYNLTAAVMTLLLVTIVIASSLQGDNRSATVATPIASPAGEAS